MPLTAEQVYDQRAVLAGYLRRERKSICREAVLSLHSADDKQIEEALPFYDILIGHLETSEIFLWTFETMMTAVNGCDKAFAGQTWSYPAGVPDNIYMQVADRYHAPDEESRGYFNLPENTILMGAQLLKSEVEMTDGTKKLGVLYVDIFAELMCSIEEYCKGITKESHYFKRLFYRPHSTMFEGEVLTHPYLELCAMYTFITTKAANVERRNLPRGERRRREREGTYVPKDFRVVTLRKTEAIVLSKEEQEAREHEWKHHWYVVPHWRNQYYPSTGEHSPVFIQEYMKGPLDKPLLEKRPTINLVNR
jgi:hypothetical protein